jgi:transmembrane sensor
MNASKTEIRPDTTTQAADWFVANRAGPLNPAGRAAYLAWLKASPIHLEEYLAIADVVRDLPAAVGDPELSLDEVVARAHTEVADGVVPGDSVPAAVGVRAGGSWRSRRWLLASAAALLVVVASVFWSLRDTVQPGRPQIYATAHGQQNIWRLSDGSTLQLNTDSRVSVEYTAAARTVVLDSGQALFAVAHDARRPFRVTAAGSDVVAVGTRFDVYRLPTATIVTVVEGRVAVSAHQTPTQSVQVGANQQVRIDAGAMAGKPVPVNAEQAVAWVRQQIAFDRQPLGEVAEEFNRYAAVPFEIEDAGLRSIRVSGVFNTYDAESFAAFLKTLGGVTLERRPEQIRVMWLSAANRTTAAVTPR